MTRTTTDELIARLEVAWDAPRQKARLQIGQWVAMILPNADGLWAWCVDKVPEGAVRQMAAGTSTERTGAVRAAAGAMSWYAHGAAEFDKCQTCGETRLTCTCE